MRRTSPTKRSSETPSTQVNFASLSLLSGTGSSLGGLFSVVRSTLQENASCAARTMRARLMDHERRDLFERGMYQTVQAGILTRKESVK